MKTGCQVSDKDANRLATARADREPEAQADSGWLHRAASQLPCVIKMEVPVGYEDEDGFHCGEPEVQEYRVSVSQPDSSLTNSHPF